MLQLLKKAHSQNDAVPQVCGWMTDASSSHSWPPRMLWHCEHQSKSLAF